MAKSYFIYIVSNDNNRVIYTGITSNLKFRIGQHKYKQVKGFTNKYNVHKLVYYEEYSDPWYAIFREKQIKSWPRKRKNELIQRTNPHWEELYVEY
ncbi:MAG: GIY-YIG nuclease family protein [Candidatus Aminicenantes bacterium]